MRKPGLFVNFGQFPCSRIRIRIPNKAPDPGTAKSMPIQADPDPQHYRNGFCKQYQSVNKTRES
jgi:hypothetical protein